MSIADLRREYRLASLDVSDVDPDPVAEFGKWLEQALRAELLEPHAMTLATASADGVPSARIVLLRGYDGSGFTFFTDYRSRKGRELADNPRAALVFYWPDLERQVRITGTVRKVSRDESGGLLPFTAARQPHRRLGLAPERRAGQPAGPRGCGAGDDEPAPARRRAAA